MNLIPTDAAGAPARWLLCFHTRSDLWWINRFIPGRFKHVRAFAAVPDCDAWVFYDPCLRTTLSLARGASARAQMLDWTRDAVVLAMTPLPTLRVRLTPFCCTSAIASLLGLPDRWCVAPTQLYRDCLRHGAQIVDENPGRPPDSADRPPA